MKMAEKRDRVDAGNVADCLFEHAREVGEKRNPSAMIMGVESVGIGAVDEQSGT